PGWRCMLTMTAGASVAWPFCVVPIHAACLAFSAPSMTLATSRRRTGAPLRYAMRSEEHTSELQSLTNLVCRLLLEKKEIISAVSFLTIAEILSRALTYQDWQWYRGSTSSNIITSTSLSASNSILHCQRRHSTNRVY